MRALLITLILSLLLPAAVTTADEEDFELHCRKCKRSISVEEAIRTAGRFMAEASTDAIKLEGGAEMADRVAGITAAAAAAASISAPKLKAVLRSGRP